MADKSILKCTVNQSLLPYFPLTPNPFTGAVYPAFDPGFNAAPWVVWNWPQPSHTSCIALSFSNASRLTEALLVNEDNFQWALW